MVQEVQLLEPVASEQRGGPARARVLEARAVGPRRAPRHVTQQVVVVLCEAVGVYGKGDQGCQGRDQRPNQLGPVVSHPPFRHEAARTDFTPCFHWRHGQTYLFSLHHRPCECDDALREQHDLGPVGVYVVRELLEAAHVCVHQPARLSLIDLSTSSACRL